MPSSRRRDGYVLRSVGSQVGFWIGVAILVVVVGTPIVRADWRVLAFVVAPALLLAWLLWMVLYRPSLRYDAERAVIVNIGRVHVIPWARVTAVRQRLGLEFELDTGRRVTAVGVPPPRRPGNVESLLDRRTRPAYDFHRDAQLLDGVRQAAPPGPGSVVSRWDIIPLAIGALLVAAVVVEIVMQI